MKFLNSIRAVVLLSLFTISTVSLLVFPTSIHAQVQNLVASKVSDTSVTLTWQNTGIAASFNSPRQESGAAFCCSIDLPAAATTVTHSGLKPATAYIFLVQARNASGVLLASYSVSTTTLASAPVPPPTSVIAQASWQDNSGNNCTPTVCDQEDRFILEFGPAGSGTLQVAGVTLPNVTSFAHNLVGYAAGTVSHNYRSAA
jgi:hypothetical protein